MRRFKTAVVYLLLACGLANVAVPVRRADAVIGAVLFANGACAAGITLIAIGGAVSTVAAGVGAYLISPSAEPGATPPGGVLTVLAIIGGVLLMDAGQVNTIAYAPLGPADAGRLGLTESELDAYNHELPELNAVRETVEGELRSMQAPGVDRSRALWARYGQALSPEALSAVSKVSGSILQQVGVGHKLNRS